GVGGEEVVGFGGDVAGCVWHDSPPEYVWTGSGFPAGPWINVWYLLGISQEENLGGTLIFGGDGDGMILGSVSWFGFEVKEKVCECTGAFWAWAWRR
ncbi:MAG: hypothetical protein ACTHN5_07975, partial [Phycisphaerae bacterium]